ncbi:hypothetical protein KIPB_011419, partial [Kipferlia bialata]|eukprot:g11419.t1
MANGRSEAEVTRSAQHLVREVTAIMMRLEAELVEERGYSSQLRERLNAVSQNSDM